MFLRGSRGEFRVGGETTLSCTFRNISGLYYDGGRSKHLYIRIRFCVGGMSETRSAVIDHPLLFTISAHTSHTLKALSEWCAYCVCPLELFAASRKGVRKDSFQSTQTTACNTCWTMALKPPLSSRKGWGRSPYYYASPVRLRTKLCIGHRLHHHITSKFNGVEEYTEYAENVALKSHKLCLFHL